MVPKADANTISLLLCKNGFFPDMRQLLKRKDDAI